MSAALAFELPERLEAHAPPEERGLARDWLDLPAGGRAGLVAASLSGTRLWVARLDLPEPLLPYLAKHGRPIHYAYVPDELPLTSYQTVYATEPGSAEMPSAGRP